MKAFLRLLVRLLFRYRAFNEAALNIPGPVLLIPNHTSWFDWLFIGVCLDDSWKFVTSSTTAEKSWFHRFVMKNRRTFPIDNASPYAVKHMAEFLSKGGKLVLFAEGRLSKTGTLMKLFDGTGFLIHKTHAKVITAYLRGASRLPFSPHPGVKRWFPTVTAHFSDALSAPHQEHLSTSQSRSLFTRWLRDQMVGQQFRTEMEFGPTSIPAAIAETAAAEPGKVILEDATLTELTYRKLLIGAGLMGERLAQQCGTSPRVGVLLPNVNATPVVLLALWQLGKVPAILNFSTGTATMLACAELAGLKHIVTSRNFLKRAKLDAAPFEQAGVKVIYLEDIRATISGCDRFAALVGSFFNRQLAIGNRQSDDTAVVLFTSGSEGVPKGVELSHRNLLANTRQMLAACDLRDDERFFNAMPLFHSFGLLAGLILPLIRGNFIFIYPSPLHYRVVPTVFYDKDCTVLFGTNTFLSGYGRKAHPYDFRSLRYLFAGAEKLQQATAELWAQKFGVRVFEGYGATECSPCISATTPLEPKHGTAGRFLPGVEWRLEAVEGIGEAGEQAGKWESETGHSPTSPLSHPHTGRLFVRGPNIMKGYLNADANAKFHAGGGWYDTGDIVSVDAEGFVSIRGRMKRFAKISGEMVSLTAVEDALAGAFPQYGLRCQTAVVTRPDEDKGEALICCTNEPKLTPAEIRDAIKAKGLSNLCVPREIVVVKEIPKLGTGKVNHRELQALVQPAK
ncbi:MAG: acyl-acyl-carrier-protein-phospholipid O-acyltransferase [Limisphaerales bacterium]|nr:MAG: acyl-acyl-carrier-protein-phospholipid O-acyltransferase [Limisphaerales bacterium]KAG0507636.1 MAG: acyl-acyl-carrier-protein-phospholipid O-acyltransferase [Limisphaerales bacterium]TXT51755.1 MAG: acyl-acyl-carrier-protein-phospholipid O-acyltransferase [Limisphaerales bacterium]